MKIDGLKFSLAGIILGILIFEIYRKTTKGVW